MGGHRLLVFFERFVVSLEGVNEVKLFILSPDFMANGNP
jgi:hypothetical protein